MSDQHQRDLAKMGYPGPGEPFPPQKPREGRVGHLEVQDEDGTITIDHSFIPPAPEAMIDDLYAAEIAALARAGVPVAVVRFPDVEVFNLIHPPRPVEAGRPYLLIGDEDGTLPLDRAEADVDEWTIGLYHDPDDQVGEVHQIENRGPGTLADVVATIWAEFVGRIATLEG